MGDNNGMADVMKQTSKGKKTSLGLVAPEEMNRHAEEASQFLKLMSNPHRLMVLCHLLDRELSVSELNEHLPLSQSALSQHLAVLRHAGIVATRREHQVIFYSLASQDVAEIISVLHELFCDSP